MTFDQIISESRSRQFAFLLDGVQANILLLLLEIARQHDYFNVDLETDKSIMRIADEVHARLESVVREERFITLADLEELTAETGKFLDAEDLKTLVEKLWNGRTR